MRGLDEGGFAHPARAPKKRVIGREALREALGIGEEDIASLVDPPQQLDIDTVDARDGDESRGPRGKDEGVGGVEIARSSRRAGEPLKSGSDPLESLGRE